jgi:hypothetical protein
MLSPPLPITSTSLLVETSLNSSYLCCPPQIPLFADQVMRYLYMHGTYTVTSSAAKRRGAYTSLTCVTVLVMLVTGW